MELIKEHVRARPAWDATASSGFGAVSWSLGLAELVAPEAILDWLGVDPKMAPLVRAFGLREIASGIGILQNPMGSGFMWARVAGDALDLMALAAAFRGSARQDRIKLALGVIGGITLLDILMSARLQQISARKNAARIGR
jgi:hypothetical protein